MIECKITAVGGLRAWVTVGAAVLAVGVPASATAATWTTAGVPHGLTGARVVADPSVAGRAYLSVPLSSAVWVTEDRGAHWVQRSAQESFYGFFVFPGPPNLLVAFSGSREVWRSVDQARTWTLVGCCAAAIDPNNPQRLIGFDAQRRLQRSTDGGATWQPATEVAGPLAEFAYTFDGAGRLWALSGTGAVFRSNDLGTTWSVVTGVPDGVLSPVAGDPSRLWVGPWRSLDGGSIWQRSGPLEASCDGSPPLGPGSPLAVWTLGCNGLYRSTDGGDVWTRMTGTAEHSWAAGSSVGVLAGGQVALVGGWQGPWLVEDGHPPQYRGDSLPRLITGPQLADPAVPGRAYSGTFMTTDAGATWVPSPGAPPSSLARVGQRLLGATEDAVVARPASGGTATTLRAGAATVASDPGGRRAFVVSGGRVLTTTDGLALRLLPTQVLAGAATSTNEIAVAAGGRQGRTVAIEFARPRTKLAVSQDGGRSFFVRPLGPGVGRVFVDAVDGRLILVLDPAGNLTVSRRGGKSFGGHMPFVSAVAVDPSRRGRWYIVQRGKLLRTVDAGRTWRAMAGPPTLSFALSAGRGRLWAADIRTIWWLPLGTARP